MKTTKIELWVQWNPAKHRDPAEWDLVELLDPEGEHKLKTVSHLQEKCDDCRHSWNVTPAHPTCPHCPFWEMT